MSSPFLSESTARTVATVGLVALAFLAGVISARFETFPYPQLLERPMAALEAHLRSAARTGDDRLGPNTDEPKGVTRHVPGKTADGLTLYASAHEQAANLVNMDGEIVHRWHLPFRRAWPDPPHVDRPVPAANISWNEVHLYPNGDLLASYSGEGGTPHGYGLVKMNRRSEVVWRYADRTHHEIEVAPNGDIYTLVHAVRDRDAVDAGLVGESPHVVDDHLVRLSADGRELERLSLLDAIGNSSMADILGFWFDRRAAWNPLHTNDVDVVPPEFAAHHPFAEAGQLLISLRSLNAIGLVDLEAGEFTWVRRGAWVAQHDPDLLENGHITLYDNHGHPGPGGASRLVEYAPGERGIVWQYTGDASRPFFSKWAGVHQQLPNGNMLITETTQGRLFEVTRDGEVVWSYRNFPFDEGREASIAPYVRAGRRVTRDWLEFTPTPPNQ